jgi:hypothetical protein
MFNSGKSYNAIQRLGIYGLLPNTLHCAHTNVLQAGVEHRLPGAVRHVVLELAGVPQVRAPQRALHQRAGLPLTLQNQLIEAWEVLIKLHALKYKHLKHVKILFKYPKTCTYTKATKSPL